MKNIAVLIPVGVLMLAPVVAAAQQHMGDVGDQWTGPYVGGELGLNQSSAYDLDTQTSLAGGVKGGYNLAVPLRGSIAPVILGGDVFATFNSQATHNGSVDYGSNVVGVDFKAGYPLGYAGKFLPYVKLGVGDLSGTGALGGSATGLRVGLGAEYKLRPRIALTAEWMHEDANHITNDNVMFGVNYRFGYR